MIFSTGGLGTNIHRRVNCYCFHVLQSLCSENIHTAHCLHSLTFYLCASLSRRACRVHCNSQFAENPFYDLYNHPYCWWRINY